jgi:hypothetical protein
MDGSTRTRHPLIAFSENQQISYFNTSRYVTIILFYLLITMLCCYGELIGCGLQIDYGIELDKSLQTANSKFSHSVNDIYQGYLATRFPTVEPRSKRCAYQVRGLVPREEYWAHTY